MSLNPGLDVVPGPHSPRSAVPRRLRAPGSTSPPTSVPRSAPRPFPSCSSPMGHGEPQAPGPASQRTTAWATLQAGRTSPSTHGRVHSSERGIHSDSRGWPGASSRQVCPGLCVLTPQPLTLAPYAGVLCRALCPQGTRACLEMVLLSRIGDGATGTQWVVRPGTLHRTPPQRSIQTQMSRVLRWGHPALYAKSFHDHRVQMRQLGP